MKKIFFLMVACAGLAVSCNKKGSDFPPEPQIYYQSTKPNTINVFDTASMTTITFRFTDGDGNIATDPADSVLSIFIRDSRDTNTTGDSTYAFPFPYIDKSIRPNGGLEGEVTLNIGRQYYRTWDSLHTALRKDTMTWNIYIKDRAGNKSNVITSDTVYIQY